MRNKSRKNVTRKKRKAKEKKERKGLNGGAKGLKNEGKGEGGREKKSKNVPVRVKSSPMHETFPFTEKIVRGRRH